MLKKIFKILGISLGSLLVLLILAIILIPLLFKGKLTELAKSIINDNLNATVDFRDVDISLFRHFPELSVSLEDLSVVSKGEKLLSVASFDAGINLMPFVKKGTIDLKSITLNSPKIHAQVLQDSSVNWDIVKPSTDAKPDVSDDEADDDTTGFKIAIENFTIVNGSVMYEDLSGKLLAVLDDINFKMKGDLSNTTTTLDINASIDTINVVSNGLMLVRNFSFAVAGTLGAELDKSLFTLTNTEFNINRIALLADGTVKIENNGDVGIDLKYGAKVASLKTLLDLIPPEFLPDAKDLTTRGNLALNGWIKGVYNDSSLPQVQCELNVADGYLKYAGLPKSVDNINIDAKALFDGNNDANTSISVNRFHFDVGGNPFDVATTVKTPMSDADIRAVVKGKLDFVSLKDALPLDGIDLKGVLAADVNFAGRMSQIEHQQYEKLNLDGVLSLTGFTAVTEDLPLPVNIAEAGLEFTPKYVNLSKFSAKIGESDVNASGRLENFLNYALKNDVLKGNLQLTSNLLNCNRLMSGASAADAATAAVDTGSLSVIVLPSNIDFSINASIGKLLYDKLTLTNARGTVSIKDHALNIDNLSAGFAGGQIKLAGKYTANDNTSALANMNMNISDIHVKDLVGSFDMFDKALPLLKEVDGKVSFDFNFSDKFDSHLSPVMTALSAVGNFRADSLKIVNQEALNKITALVGLKDRSNTLRKVNAHFTVTDGRVGVTPFALNAGGANMMLGGDYGIDNSLNMQVDVKLPAAQVTDALSSQLSQWGVKSDALNAKTVNVGVAVGGSLKSPTFGLTKAKYLNADEPAVTEQVKEEAKQLIEEKKQELQTQLEEKAKDELQKQKDATANKLKDLFKKQ